MHSFTAVKGRPELYTSYAQDMALLNTPGKRVAAGAVLMAALLLPFAVADDLLVVLATGFAAAVGAIGLNIVTGYAGQVSLGHAFFLGLGAYTAAFLGGAPGGRAVGLGLPLVVWLPAAGIVAAAAGFIVAPIASRLRGLYLAIVTLGLVFLGEHIFKEAVFVTGGLGVGRPAAKLSLFGFSFDAPAELAGIPLTVAQLRYGFCLAVLVVLGVLARNLARSAVGRALAAVRDRDIAAEVIGVNLQRSKTIAFVVSSFYAGIAGALGASLLGFFDPSRFTLGLSIQFVAMVLIGGVATISGAVLGAMFITLLPRITAFLPGLLPFVSAQPTGGVLTIFQIEAILYGALIVGFLIFEPRGLFGIWIRIRNYWKGWPFSY